jgi:ElaB/YqjD/DUF883 family membrane-anchored ribosome-binding protein
MIALILHFLTRFFPPPSPAFSPDDMAGKRENEARLSSYCFFMANAFCWEHHATTGAFMYLVKSNTLPKSARKIIKEGKSLAQSASRELQQSGSSLGKQVAELYPEVAATLREIAGRTAEQARTLIGTTGRELGVVGTRAVRYMDSNVVKIGVLYAFYRWLSGHQEVIDATEKVKEQIRQRPVESAVIAAGIGYLVGRLLRW